MALKQMSLARMGEYRPPVRAVGDGGKTGRPKLLHNGTGAGLTGGGGLNAKGTGGGIKVPAHMRGAQRSLRKAKYQSNKFNALKLADRRREADKRTRTPEQQTQGGRAMRPYPVGRFQYGHDQWGFINARGQVNWNSSAPTGKMPVIGFNQALPYLRQIGALTKMPARKPAPAYYEDPIYARQMAGHNDTLAQAKAAFEYAKNAQGQNFSQQMTGISNEMLANRRQANAGLSGANLAGSGISAATLGELERTFLEDRTQTALENQTAVDKINTDLQLAQNSFDTQHTAEQGVAKERWLATHPGAKPPKTAGITTVNGRPMHTNAQGIPMTWTPKPKPKPARRPARPVR